MNAKEKAGMMFITTRRPRLSSTATSNLDGRLLYSLSYITGHNQDLRKVHVGRLIGRQTLLTSRNVTTKHGLPHMSQPGMGYLTSHNHATFTSLPSGNNHAKFLPGQVKTNQGLLPHKNSQPNNFDLTIHNQADFTTPPQDT